MKGMKISCALLVSVASFAVITGCAGTAPTVEFQKPIADINRLCRTDEAKVTLTTSDGSMSDASLKRLESLLQHTIDQKKNAVRCKAPGTRAFVLNSTITTYDEGIASDRSKLSGLAQLIIEGNFDLSPLQAGSDPVAEFTVHKNFAWAGLIGVSTGIEDLYPAFAEGVAEAIVAPAMGK